MIEPVGKDEEVGRRVFDHDTADEAAKASFNKGRQRTTRALVPKKGTRETSVERLTKAPPDVALRNGEDDARSRSCREGKKRTFYGWLVLAVRYVHENNCKVLSSPTATNPYHAHIEFPSDERESILEHAIGLARRCTWRGKPRHDAMQLEKRQ